MDMKEDIMKKIIFMGTPAFSTNVLKALIESEYEVIAVVTQPDREVGRKKTLTASPVKQLALQYAIPVYQPEKLSGSLELKELMTLGADLIVTAAYGQFLPSSFLEYPTYKAINVHASLLPKYRGGAPIHYAIMNGESQTGITIMKMEKKMDAGDILSQRSIPITHEDDVESMFEKLSHVGAQLLMETLPGWFAGTIQRIPQNEAEATFSPNITREQEEIDWRRHATQVDCFIRGLRPWPTSYTVLEGERYKIWKAHPTDQLSEKPCGTMFVEHHQLYVVCGEKSVLQVEMLQPAGKSKMDAAAFINGFSSVWSRQPRFDIKES